MCKLSVVCHMNLNNAWHKLVFALATVRWGMDRSDTAEGMVVVLVCAHAVAVGSVGAICTQQYK